jgi:hypothetical protein
MAQSELNTALASDDPEMTLRAVVALRRLADQVESASVASARSRGWTWEEIGDALGVSRQSVHVKYGKKK